MNKTQNLPVFKRFNAFVVNCTYDENKKRLKGKFSDFLFFTKFILDDFEELINSGKKKLMKTSAKKATKNSTKKP